MWGGILQHGITAGAALQLWGGAGFALDSPALERRSRGHRQLLVQALTGGERGVTLLVMVFSPSEFVRPVL